LLFKLADDKDVAMIISRTVADNFDRLSEDKRNDLLLKVADNKDAAYYVVDVIANFDKLPKDAQNLLVKLADNKETAVSVARVMGDSLDELPEDIKIELQKKISKTWLSIG
jgi:hypothetical protein